VQEQNQHKIALMIVNALTSAIIVLWMAYLPTLVGGILTNLNIVPTHLSSPSDTAKHANKDDQLTAVRFADRWNALAAMTIRTLGENGVHGRATELVEERIPIGCEATFSPLAKTGHLSARCVASADVATRLAKVE
jgi:hypothetical protein